MSEIENQNKQNLEKNQDSTAQNQNGQKNLENPESEEEKKAKKKKIIIISVCAALAVIILVIVLLIVSCGQKKNAKTRENTYGLAKIYAENGEYDRALSLLEQLLIKNADDEVAQDLFNQILGMKKDVEEGKVARSFRDDSINVNIDTSGLKDVMHDSLSSMQTVLEQSNKQAQENGAAVENLLKLQEDKNRQDELRRIQEETKLAQAKAEEEAAKLKAAEAEQERKEREAAAAEQKRIAEEKRKAEEAAIAAKNEKLKKDIDQVNDNIKKGETALATGNIEEAEKYFANAQSIMPGEAGKDLLASKESQMAQAYYDAAQNATNQADKDKLMNQAVQMAEKAVKDNPNDASSHYILAQNAAGNKDYNLAINELNKAIQNDPNNYLYYYELGKIQYRTKKYSEAAISFDTSCKKKSDFAPARYNLGLSYLKINNDSLALEAFRQTIDISPRHEKAWLEQARILAKRGDYNGSIAAYESVLAINNINTTATMELGSVYYQSKKYEKAEESYHKAISMLSDGEEKTLTKYNLSTVLFDEGKYDDAEKYAKEAYEGLSYVKNSKSKANLVYNYALMKDNKNDVENAIPLYLEVLKYNPDHLKTKVNLGVMYMNLTPPDVDTALRMFLEVYEADNRNFEANNNLGSAYLQKEDYKNAILYFQNALRIDSKNNTVRSNLARAYAQDGDYNNAKAVYSELIRQDNKNWDGYIELAKVCMQLHDNENAEKYLVYVEEMNPGYRTSEIDALIAGLEIGN